MSIAQTSYALALFIAACVAIWNGSPAGESLIVAALIWLATFRLASL